MLSDVYDALVAAMAAYGCPAEVLLGPQWLDQHTGTLRVVLVQGDDEFGNIVPSVPQGTTGYNRQQINPRPLASRMCGVRCELWATAPQQRDPSAQYRADLAFLDALVNTVIASLNATVFGISNVKGGSAAPNNGESVRAGLGYTLTFSVGVPVTDSPWPKQQLSACSQTWTEAPAEADVAVRAGSTDSPTFHVPTPA